MLLLNLKSALVITPRLFKDIFRLFVFLVINLIFEVSFFASSASNYGVIRCVCFFTEISGLGKKLNIVCCSAVKINSFNLSSSFSLSKIMKISKSYRIF